MPEARSTKLPRVIGVAAALAALLGYGGLLFFVPAILDWAFDEGGKAPMLIAMVGAALTVGAFLGAERVAVRAPSR